MMRLRRSGPRSSRRLYTGLAQRFPLTRDGTWRPDQLVPALLHEALPHLRRDLIVRHLVGGLDADDAVAESRELEPLL